MDILSKLLGRKHRSIADYIQAGVRKKPIDEMCEILKLWMETAPPAKDERLLASFMDGFSRLWGSRWHNGDIGQVLTWFRSCAKNDIRVATLDLWLIIGLDVPSQDFGIIKLEPAPDWWADEGVSGSVLELIVAGFCHVVGKASPTSYFYVAHQ